jgi:hypothetical protein
MTNLPDITIRWRHTPDAPAGSSLPALLAGQPDLTIPAGADDDEIGDQVGSAVRKLMAEQRIHLDVVALVDGDDVTVADADEPVWYGRASVIRASAVEHPHAELIAGLREIADLLESRPDLPVGRIPITVGVGPVESLDGWMDALDATPYLSGRIPILSRTVAPALEIRVQGREVDMLTVNGAAMAEAVAVVNAEVAEIATDRTESDR